MSRALPNPTISNPICQTLISGYGLYRPNPYLSSTFAKYVYKFYTNNVDKMAENVQIITRMV